MLSGIATVRSFHADDLDAVAAVHAEAFPRQSLSREWIAANAGAYPRARYFVAEEGAEVVGYVLWLEKSGFRHAVVLELEQIAVAASHRRRGVGEALIRQSLLDVRRQIEIRGSTISAVMVTTRADNRAKGLYERVLGAKVEATISGLFAADEVIMVAKNPMSSSTSFERSREE